MSELKPVAAQFIVTDAAGLSGVFSRSQIDWLVGQDVIQQTEVRATGPQAAFVLYKVLTGESVHAVHERIMREPSLAECDFCRYIPARWRVNVHPFTLEMGFNQRVPFNRPVAACDECVPFVRERDRKGLLEHALAKTIDYARETEPLASHIRGVPRHHVEAQVFPLLRVFVMKVLGNRKGWPERIG